MTKLEKSSWTKDRRRKARKIGRLKERRVGSGFSHSNKSVLDLGRFILLLFMYRICLLYSNAKYLFEEIEESLAFLLLLLLLLLDNTLRLWRLYSYLYPNGVCIGGDYE